MCTHEHPAPHWTASSLRADTLSQRPLPTHPLRVSPLPQTALKLMFDKHRDPQRAPERMAVVNPSGHSSIWKGLSTFPGWGPSSWVPTAQPDPLAQTCTHMHTPALTPAHIGDTEGSSSPRLGNLVAGVLPTHQQNPRPPALPVSRPSFAVGFPSLPFAQPKPELRRQGRGPPF